MNLLAPPTDVIDSFLSESNPEPFLTWTPSEKETRQVVKEFLGSEPGWIDFAIDNDPVLKRTQEKTSREEAIKEVLTYSGLHAIAWHRKAHAEYEKSNFAEARKISQGVKRLTAGIEIHPGAQIGENFFIDHGSGVVIGETAEIGNNVMLYHRVTLGSDGDKSSEGRRHPKLGDNVIICTGVDVLGPATIGSNTFISAGTRVIGNPNIGNDVQIGPQLVIRRDIPDSAKVVGYKANEGYNSRTSAYEPVYSDRFEFDKNWTSRIEQNSSEPIEK